MNFLHKLILTYQTLFTSQVSPSKKVNLQTTPRYNPRPARASGGSAGKGAIDPIAIPLDPLPPPPVKQKHAKGKQTPPQPTAGSAGKVRGRKGRPGRKPKGFNRKADESEAGEETEDTELGTSVGDEGDVEKMEGEYAFDEEDEQRDAERPSSLFQVSDGMAPDQRDFLQRLQEFLDPKALVYANNQVASLRGGEDSQTFFLFCWFKI